MNPSTYDAVPDTPGQHARSFSGEVRKQVRLNYLLFLPRGYASSNQRWPLMIFLHGSGERGNDLAAVKGHGPPKLVEHQPDFPFVLVSPQVPAGMAWDSDALAALLDELLRTLRVDADRVVVTGLSMGGYGAWNFATDYPERVAAIAPISGAGDADRACRLKDVPVWAFHGAQDTVVDPRADQEMVDALRACGGRVRYTLYPDAGHDAWTRSYEDPALYAWLLGQRRPRP